MKQLQTIDADTLMSTPLPVTKFIVESFLPEGLHMMTRYIVTGAAEHLGSTIIRLLRDQEKTVRGLILPAEDAVFPDVEYMRGNILEPGSLRPLFQRSAGEKLVVIHTAGLVDVSGEMNQRLYDVNVNGTKNILMLCREYQVDNHS